MDNLENKLEQNKPEEQSSFFRRITAYTAREFVSATKMYFEPLTKGVPYVVKYLGKKIRRQP